MRHVPLLLLLLATGVALLQFVPLQFFDIVAKGGIESVASAETETKIDVASQQTTIIAPLDTREVVTHVPLPQPVKMIYMTSCVAGTPSFRDRLIKLIAETEINSVIIDIKDYSGTISFSPTDPTWKYAWENARCGARDMKALVAQLHAQNVYVVGRITVFQDPLYAVAHPTLAVQRLDRQTVWKDGKGLSFVDVASQPYWEHIVNLAVESYNLGFDELNFDYVRYPSDGNMQDIWFPQTAASTHGFDKQANLEAFFAYLQKQLSDETRFAAVAHSNTGRATNTPYTSADLFGMTTTNYDDLSIGQVQDRAAPYFDFIAPMVYPSHYPHDYLGLGNPNDHPYKVVYHAMKTGVDRMQASTTPMAGFLHTPILTTSASSTPVFTGMYAKPVYGPDKFRTWIQDFDYGGDYDAADVRAQIQASNDAGVMSWMIWAPSNIYTRAALKDAQ